MQIQISCMSNPWVADTPYDIRDEAMADLLKAYESNFAKGTVSFEMKFRSKKDKTQSIAILKKHRLLKKGAYADMFKGLVPERGATLPEKLPADSRLIRTRLNQYYLCMPEPITQHPMSEAPNPAMKCTIALDPGVRTFMTGYDPDGATFEWGKRDMGRINRLCYAFDKLQSKIDTSTSAVKKRRMRKAGIRLQQRIRNLVDEVHKKLAKWLCEQYRVILLPKFESSQMVSTVKTKRRVISGKTARAMLTWSHFRFRQRLLAKAREYPWCRVVTVTEEYTSKTCGACGHIHDKLGSNKEFKCPKCNVVLDRDVNGARNILLKYLSALRGFEATLLSAV